MANHFGKCSFRSSSKKHESTGFSPFYILYNREPVLPIDIKYNICDEEPSSMSVDEITSSMCAIKKEISERASNNIAQAQLKQKKDYSKRRGKCQTIKEGDKVLLRNLKRDDRKGGKCQKTWLGPYVCSKIHDKNLCELKSEGNDTLKKRYNMKHLRIYHQRQVVKTSTGNDKPERENLCADASGSQSVDKKLQTVKIVSKRQRNSCAVALGLQLFILPELQEECTLGEPKKVKQIEGDGNCFFRAICYIITGSQKEHLKLREQVIAHMIAKCSTKLHDYLLQDVHQYIANSYMAHSSTWATDAEILGAASLLKHDILVYAKFGSSVSWLRYPASLSLDLKSKECLLLRNFDSHFEPVLVV